MLGLEKRISYGLGKLEYENVAVELIRRAREFNFFVGVKKDWLERVVNMVSSTYSSMLSYGYIAVAGTVNDTDVIVPTKKLLELGHTLPAKN